MEGIITSLVIKKETRDKLKDAKLVKMETYDELINRLLVFYKIVKRLKNDLNAQKYLKNNYNDLFIEN